MGLLSTFSGKKFECGTDEAGRGCLAGPVTAAAVILPKEFRSELLNDSKSLSHNKRIHLKSLITTHSHCISYTHLWPDTIDKINILNASLECMHLSIEKLNIKPEFIIVDGNRFKSNYGIPHKTIVKGDSKYLSIAAASIIAKTERDAIMVELHKEYPMYNWEQNKGYPTKEHREAIMKYGITKYHRQSFRLIPDQLQLNL